MTKFQKTKFVFIVLIFCGIFALAEGSQAADLYVDKDGKHNNNVSNCSDNYSRTDVLDSNWVKNFCTIQKAATLVNPGDTVIVADGIYADVYNENYVVYIKRTGSAGNYITFKSENKWGAIIDGTDWTRRTCMGFDLNAGVPADYIKIEDFEIRNCSNGIYNSGAAPAGSNHVYKGNKIHHIYNFGISEKNGGVPSLELPGNISIDSNIIYDIGRYNPAESPNYHSIYLTDGKNMTITNNILYEVIWGWMLHLYPHGMQNVTVANNIFDMTGHNDAGGYGAQGAIIIAEPMHNLLIENNIIYGAKTAAIRAYSHNSGNGIQIKNNLTDSSAMCVAGTGYNCNDYAYSENLISTNPLFADAGNRNYHLQSNSLAIDNGLADNAPTYDIEGALRPQGTTNPKLYDIGAYEYQGGDLIPSAAPSGLSVN